MSTELETTTKPAISGEPLLANVYIRNIGLFPCPFCGKKPEAGALGDGRFTIKCYECGIIMIQDRRDKLKALWNRRNNKINK